MNSLKLRKNVAQMNKHIVMDSNIVMDIWNESSEKKNIEKAPLRFQNQSDL